MLKSVFDMTLEELQEYSNDLIKRYPVPRELLYLHLRYICSTSVYKPDIANQCKALAMLEKVSLTKTNSIRFEIPDKPTLKNLAEEFGYSYGYIRKVASIGKWTHQKRLIKYMTVKMTRLKIMGLYP